jgi:hypothetical protein
VEAALEHTVMVEQGRVQDLEEQLQITLIEKTILIQQQKKGEAKPLP